MRDLVKKIGRISLGVLLILIGIIGGFIPILQGWIFILLGLSVLSKDVPFVKEYRDKLEAKYGAQLRKWLEARKSKHRCTYQFFFKHGLLILGLVLIVLDSPLIVLGYKRGFTPFLEGWIYTLPGLGILAIVVYGWKRLFGAVSEPVSPGDCPHTTSGEVGSSPRSSD